MKITKRGPEAIKVPTFRDLETGTVFQTGQGRELYIKITGVDTAVDLATGTIVTIVSPTPVIAMESELTYWVKK